MSYGQIIGASVPAGFAGEIARGEFDYTAETRVNNAAAPVAAFGVAVKLADDGSVTPTTAAGDAVFGFSLRLFGQADLTGGQAAHEKALPVLRRGYFFAKAAGTPIAGGKVNLASDGAITADEGTAIPNAVFSGTVDSDGLVEIAYNI